MGVDGDIANVTGEELGEFCQSWILTMKVDGFKWKLVNVYGSTHDDRKMEFLDELQMIVLSSEVPILLGGDFNMVRKIEEKSNGNINFRFLDAFNEMINLTGLRELHRSGSRFTWTNKQNPPIMCVLDRVLVSNEW
jgi:exonuclease III